jgi:hypothetical protein
MLDNGLKYNLISPTFYLFASSKETKEEERL